MASSKQSGKSLLWIIGGIVIVGLAALLVWQYMNTTSMNDEDSEMIEQQDVVVLPDWGLEIHHNFDTYGIIAEAKKDDNTYVLTSSKLEEGTYICQQTTDENGILAESVGELGTITRSDAAAPAEAGESVQLGDKYYTFVGALQNSCYQEAELNLLPKTFGGEFSQMLVDPEVETDLE